MTMSSKFPWENVWHKNTRYSRDENRLRKAQMKFLAFKELGALERPLGRVLEIGCGNCIFAKIAKESGLIIDSFVGIDKSDSALERAKLNVKFIPNAYLMQGDACRLPLAENSVDTIVALGVLEHVKDLDVCLKELARVAAPGARFLVSTSNTRSMMYAARLLRETVGAWCYGFQRNDSIESLSNHLYPFFRILRARSLHGDRDFIFSTLMDILIGIFNKKWGRYVLAEALFIG